MTETLFYNTLTKYVTLYGDGRININTASAEVLDALFGTGYPELGGKIADYRRGVDGKVGTDDDRWFTIGAFVIEREDMGLVDVKNLNDENWYGNIFGITDNEYKRIKELAGTKGLLSTNSDFYRANVTASVDNIKKSVETVFMFKKPDVVRKTGFSEEIPPPDILYLYWHEGR